MKGGYFLYKILVIKKQYEFSHTVELAFFFKFDII